MADSAQDKQLPATERRIQKAREEGQAPRSRDLGHFAACFIGGLAIVLLAPPFVAWMSRTLTAGLRFDASTLRSAETMSERLGANTLVFVLASLPMGLLMVAVGIGAALASGGWNLSFKALQPKLDKFNPVTGFGRLFSSDQLIQTAKACGLALALGAVAALYLQFNLPRFVQSLALPLPAALAHAGTTIWGGLVAMLFVLGAVALIDVPLQRFLFLKRLRMSHQEVKEEHKDAEGNTEVKGKMKVRMREMANRRMLAAVPKADVVVMNPTHFAVALKYDEASMAAPKVVAKGADLMAMRIRDAAQAAKVPVLQAPPLARALYAHAELDREIPAALFAAVAQVLAWVYQLRRALAGQGPSPQAPTGVEIPEGLDPLQPRKPATLAAGENA
jgi:flagellar biosynthetic protein FlhB